MCKEESTRNIKIQIESPSMGKCEERLEFIFLLVTTPVPNDLQSYKVVSTVPHSSCPLGYIPEEYCVKKGRNVTLLVTVLF